MLGPILSILHYPMRVGTIIPCLESVNQKRESPKVTQQVSGKNLDFNPVHPVLDQVLTYSTELVTDKMKI